LKELKKKQALEKKFKDAEVSTATTAAAAAAADFDIYSDSHNAGCVCNSLGLARNDCDRN
jgi:hypothetical protein